MTDDRNLSPILETSREDESLESSNLATSQVVAEESDEKLQLSTSDPCSDDNIALYVFEYNKICIRRVRHDVLICFSLIIIDNRLLMFRSMDAVAPALSKMSDFCLCVEFPPPHVTCDRNADLIDLGMLPLLCAMSVRVLQVETRTDTYM